MGNELRREIQELHKDGQSLRIVRRLRRFMGENKGKKFPGNLDMPVVIEAIINVFLMSPTNYELNLAFYLMLRLLEEERFTRSDLDKLYHALGDAVLKSSDTPYFFSNIGMIAARDKNAPERLIKLYARAGEPYVKAAVAYQIGQSYTRHKSLLAQVDCLYSQGCITGEDIRAILEKHALLDGINLEPEECDVIISAALGYLEVPGSGVGSLWDENKEERIKWMIRLCAVRVLVALDQHPCTWNISRVQIRARGDLIFPLNNRNSLVAYLGDLF